MHSTRKADLENLILEKLASRSIDSTLCPSEILMDDEKQNKTLMEDVRSAARRLHDKGLIDFYQKGKKIDPQQIKGPVRLMLRPK